MTRKRSNNKGLSKTVYACLAIAAFLVFAFLVQGARGLWERDEGRYTNVAVNMLVSGDYLHPRLNPETPHYSKPPVAYWSIAGAVGTFGAREWAARLPNTIAFLLTLLAIYGLGRIFVSDNPYLPVLVYGAAIIPLGAANYINADTLLTCFETLGVLALAALLWSPRHRHRLALSVAAGVLFGLAFLTKGPPGWLPLLAVIAYAATGHWKELGSRVSWLVFIVSLVLVGGSWFFAVTSQSPELWDYFVNVEFKDRVLSNRFHRNSEWYGAFKVYLPTLLFGFLPWSLAVIVRFKPLFGKCRPANWIQDPRVVFLACWFAVPMVVFFLARSRLPLYILPCFVPLSLITARALSGLFERRTLTLMGASSAAVVAAVLVGLSWYPYRHDARALAEYIQKQTPPPQEVVFVSTRPYYGLAFYLNAEVEEVQINPDSANQQSLEHELQEDEHEWLWIVEERKAKTFETYLQNRGFAPRRLDNFLSLAIFEST